MLLTGGVLRSFIRTGKLLYGPYNEPSSGHSEGCWADPFHGLLNGPYNRYTGRIMDRIMEPDSSVKCC